MGIIVDKNTRVIVQGITGKQGSFQTKLMLEYGTKIVAGVTPGKGGTKIHNVPVYDTIEEAVKENPAEASIIFVPAHFVEDAASEAIENGIKKVIIITEHVPLKDTISIIAFAKQAGALIIGPNTPGIITPGECKLGIMPAHIFKSGSIGMVSRSGTLAYEIAANLTKNQMGQSTCVGIGGDPIVGLNFIDILKFFE
ncbi:MAG: CoA-binding protein, partial [Candidatus Bathyarchaeia archaeon]